MTDPEAAEKERIERQERLASAWTAISQHKDFRYVFEQDLQRQFGMFTSSFRSEDNFNPHAAAKRDGNKEVLNHIASRLARGTAMFNADTTATITKETVSEFQGTTP